MNKKVAFFASFIFLLSGMSLIFSSCISSDDDEDIDEAWKLKNEVEFSEAAASTDYKKIYSYSTGTSPDGSPTGKYILSKASSVITDSDLRRLSTKKSSDGYAEFTDSIKCRYEGWYIDSDNEKYIFDSTENPTTGSTTMPNKVERTFAVAGVIEGWRTALQEMKEGDEVEIVIPQKLAYGSSAYSTIPAYTTLHFRLKLIKIIQMKGYTE